MSVPGAGNAAAPLEADKNAIKDSVNNGDQTEDTDDTDYTSKTFWEDDIYPVYDTECEMMFPDGEYYPSYSVQEDDLFAPEGEEFPFFPFYAQEGEEESMESPIYRRASSSETAEEVASSPEESHRRSLFVHSSPSNFPDVSLARKSVFGSIFLRTTGQAMEDATLLKTVVDSSYSMLHSLLNSYERIATSITSEAEKKEMALAYKTSLLKTLETHGISRLHSDGSIHWNIYPIARDYLFSVQVGNHIHQTRLLSRIEERIISGSTQRPRFPFVWPTNSMWTGHWDALGMAGVGTYIMPHGVSYNGKMQNGRFHDDNATLTYPNKFKALHCVFVKGKLMSCQFQFPDLLMHDKENWNYCKLPDRRFWSEMRNGLKPAKTAQKTEVDPPRKIPPGCYDTNDGFYDPRSLMLTSPSGELLRIPVCAEDFWIKKYCRKGFVEPANFRPDLYENWFNYDQELIQAILDGQAKYRAGEYTFADLQQHYADLGILPSWSPYKKRRTPSEIALDKWMASVPEPLPVRPPRKEKKYSGHKLPPNLRAMLSEWGSLTTLPSAAEQRMFEAKSFLRFHEASKHKAFGSSANIAGKASKISFKLAAQDMEPLDKTLKKDTSSSKREIPENYLRYQPVLKLPFEGRTSSAPERTPSEILRSKLKCQRSRESYEESQSLGLSLDEEMGEAYERELERQALRKYFKSLIMEKVTEILIEERERHRKRLRWAREIPQKHVRRDNATERCLRVLEDLFDSIPEKEEYCDSDPKRSCDLKKFAEDKYQMLQYWGKRIYKLQFGKEENN